VVKSSHGLLVAAALVHRNELIVNTTDPSQQGIPRPPTPTSPDQQPRPPEPRGHVGWIVAGSLAFGLAAAPLLVSMPFIPAEPSELTGAVLCGFALGWAMLAVLSSRFTDQPHRWAWAPTVFMGLGGFLLIGFGSGVDDVLRWVWPPAMLVLAVWLVMRIRRDMRSRTGRGLLYPVIAVLAVASIAGGYETVRAATATEYEAPGRLIDVGGHRLHLHCSGSGSPTVVLEPGGGLMSSTTGWIAPAVARDTRVCAYDRAGHGWSEPPDAAQDATQIAKDLHTLLHRGNVPEPYVLAGHSFGGLYSLTYASHYPGDVAGMVLIDSTAPAEVTTPPRTSPTSSGNPLGRVSALLSSTARFGLPRLVASGDYGTLPPRSRDEARASGATAENLRTTIDEYLQAGASAKEAAALTSFGDKPLFVLTAGVGSSSDWMPKQDKLAALSTNSVHRVAEGADHAGLIEEKRSAAITSQAILDVVASVRSRQPLAS
jgi:pimeloyl-ACP methyl ester carboxylesterase